MKKSHGKDRPAETIPDIPTAESTIVSIEQILCKEEEIRERMERAEKDAQRMIEEAKFKANDIKKQALRKDIGKEIREREIASATEQGEEAAAKIVTRVESIKSDAMTHIDNAADIILGKVLPGGLEGRDREVNQR